jgi:hypothetical protein
MLLIGSAVAAFVRLHDEHLLSRPAIIVAFG